MRKSYTKSGYQKFAGVNSIRSTYNDGTVVVGSKIAKVQPKGDYARTLIDPFGVSGVRIPDLSCYPTATYRSEKQISWVPQFDGTGTNSSTAMVIDLSPDPQYQLLKGAECSDAGKRRLLNPTGSSVPEYKAPLSTNLGTRFARARLVSAAVIVRYSGNDSECQGTISIVNDCGSVVDGNLNLLNDVSAANVNNATAQKLFYKGPLKNGAAAVYRPLDSAAFAMKKIDTSWCYGQFVISIQGAKVTANLLPLLEVHIVANFEGVISDNTAGVDEEAFAMDTQATEYGLSAATVHSSCFAATLQDIARMGSSANAVGKAVKKRAPDTRPSTPYKSASSKRRKVGSVRPLSYRK